MTIWDDPDDEALAVESQRARLARIDSYKKTAGQRQGQAQAASRIAAAYPHMNAGQIMPLALSGATADSPVTQQVAVASAKKNKKKRSGFWGLVDRGKDAVGDVIGAGADVIGAGADAARWAGDIGSDVLKPIARYGTAALAAPIEEGIGAARFLASNLGEIGAGVISGAAAGASVGVGGAVFGGVGAIPGVLGGALFGGVAGGVGGAVAEMKGVDVEGSGWRPQSALLTSLTGGPGLGEGYLPGKAVTEAAAERARETGRIGKHAWTPGRFFGATAFDEDSTGYNLLSGLVDLGVSVKLDPSAVVGARYAKVTKEFKTFQRANRNILKGATKDERLAAGLVDGSHRPGIVRENVRSYLDSAKGVKLKQALAENGDFEDLRKALPSVENETLLALRDASTADEIDLVLNGKLGIAAGLEEMPKAPRVNGILGSEAVTVRRKAADTRFLQNMPRGAINLTEPEEAIEQFSRLQSIVKLPYETISRNNEALARALADKDIARAEAILVKDFVGGEQGVLKQLGVHGPMREQMTKVWDRTSTELRAEVLDDVSSGRNIPAVRLGGETMQLPVPALMAEVLESVVDIDQQTIRELRRLTTRYPTLMTNPASHNAIEAADFMTGKVWKLTTLVRGAYTVRNLAEASLRMAAVGLDTAVSHPIDYMAWLAAEPNAMGRVLRKMGVKARGAVDPIGAAYNENPLEFERLVRGEQNFYAGALNRDARANGWLDNTLARGQHQQTWTRDMDPDRFSEAVVERLELLHRDPLVRVLSDPAKQHMLDRPDLLLRDPDLGSILDELAETTGARRFFAEAPSPQGAFDVGGAAGRHPALEDFVRRSLKQAQTAAGNDSRLWDILATGTADGIPMRKANGAINPDFKKAVRKIVDTGGGPDKVVGSSVRSASLGDRYNRGVRRVFDIIEGGPTAAMVSSPTFRQFQWEETRKLIAEATPEAQRALIDAAGEAGMSKTFLDDLRGRARVSSGDLNHDEITVLSGARGMRQTRKLLYQATDKSNLVDILRIVAPFMAAQNNSLKTWAKLGTQNPQVLRRAGQIMQGARGAGIFYKDPQTGEEMFAYPGSKLLTDTLFGQPIPLGGSVKGLNVFGSGLIPGMGPVVQVSARWVIPDTPKFDNLRDIIDPFGESTEDGGVFSQMMEEFVPGFAAKLATGFSGDMDDRKFGDAVFSVFSAGVSSGEYDNTTPEGIEAGMNSAKAKAKGLFMLQGLATLGGAPSNPAPEFVAKDKNGQWTMIAALKEELRTLQEQDPKNADELFLAKFGTNVGMLIQPTTYMGGKVLSDATTAAGDWVRKNTGVVEDYDAVYGVFAPTVDTDDFDSQTWARQIRTGQRWPLDPEQRVKMANDRLAKTVFYNAKDRFGPYPTGPQKQVLRLLRESLAREYPGFEEGLDLPEKVKIEDKVAQLETAADDERLADNPVTPALKTYLAARTALNAQAVAAGRADINQAKDMAPLRAVLRQLGEALSRENPSFDTAWDRILRAEIAIDEVDTEAGTLA